MAKRGTGFRIREGAMSYFEDSGGSGGKWQEPFNLNALPFGPDGTGNDVGNDEFNAQGILRYKGGKEEFARKVPQGFYGEKGWLNEPLVRILFERWRAGEPVESAVWHFDGSPEDWDGHPTVREYTDFAYAVKRPEAQALYSRLIGNDGTRGPRNPTPVPMKLSNIKYVYVETADGRHTYWLNTLWKPGMGPMYGEGYPVALGPEVPPTEPTKPPTEPSVVPPTEPEEPPPTANLAAKVEALLVRLQVLEKNYGDLAAKVTRGFRAIRKGGKP